MKKNQTIACKYSTIEEYWKDYDLINLGESENTYWDTFENGSRRKLEKKLTGYYKCDSLLLLNSGMSCIIAILDTYNLKTNDVIVIGNQSYFETDYLIKNYYQARGVKVEKVDISNSADIKQALIELEPKLCLFETISNSPKIQVLDFDTDWFELAPNTIFVIDNSVQNRLTMWFEIVPKQYHDRIIIIESGAKYITDKFNFGIVYGSVQSIDRVREFSTYAGIQLQQEIFFELKEKMISRAISQLKTQSNNVYLFKSLIDTGHFEYFVKLDDYIITYRQSVVTKNGIGCLIFFNLGGKNLKSRHRNFVNRFKFECFKQNIIIDIRAGFGYKTTSIRTYEDNKLNLASKSFFIRISVGVESSIKVKKMAIIINQLSKSI